MQEFLILLPVQASALQHGLHQRLLAAADAAFRHLKEKQPSMARLQQPFPVRRAPLSTKRTAAAQGASSSPAAAAGKGQACSRSAPEPWDSPRQLLLRALLLLKHLALASPNAQARLSCSVLLPLLLL
jgi:hypothetical protein